MPRDYPKDYTGPKAGLLDDRNGAIIGSMRNAFRKLASAAMQDGFESGYQVGYKSGLEASSGKN